MASCSRRSTWSEELPVYGLAFDFALLAAALNASALAGASAELKEIERWAVIR
jgi:hypothetical protein